MLIYIGILNTIWPVGHAAKTPPSQGGIMGSIPVRVTIQKVIAMAIAFLYDNRLRESKRTCLNEVKAKIVQWTIFRTRLADSRTGHQLEANRNDLFLFISCCNIT